jgi:hypothetical protein
VRGERSAFRFVLAKIGAWESRPLGIAAALGSGPSQLLLDKRGFLVPTFRGVGPGCSPDCFAPWRFALGFSPLITQLNNSTKHIVAENRSKENNYIAALCSS